MRKFVKLWGPVILWITVIFFLSNYPVPKGSEVVWQDFVMKKTWHMIEYDTLFILIFRAFKNSFTKKETKTLFWLAICLTVLYACSDEFHQTFILGRTGTPRDVLIDTGGALLGWITIWKLLPKAPNKLKNWARSLQII